MSFNNTNVLGNFNNDGFTLFLKMLEIMNMFLFLLIYIYMDHGMEILMDFLNDKPDKWIMEFKPDMNLLKISSDNFITTFSNSPCWSNYCLRQSYPEVYPFENNPLKLVHLKLIYKLCIEHLSLEEKQHLYQIEKGFKSSGNNIVVRFYDELYQPNAIDKDGVPQQKCDESWSLDNLKVRVIKYK